MQNFVRAERGKNLSPNPSDFNSDSPDCPTVFVVDDDYFARSEIQFILEQAGWRVKTFASCEAFLAAYQADSGACLVTDVHFPTMSGLELVDRLAGFSPSVPVVLVSGASGISEAVRSMKAGASDFLEKPIVADRLVASVTKALGEGQCAQALNTMHEAAQEHIAELTPRQLQIMGLVLAGQPSKNIAADLGISQRTVENHRASIMHKTGARSLPALAKLALSLVWSPDKAAPVVSTLSG